MSGASSITFSRNISATPVTVWKALTSAAEIKRWWGERVKLSKRMGGSFHDSWQTPSGVTVATVGRTLKVSQQKLLVIDWADTDWDFKTVVTFRLTSRNAATHFSVNHTGWSGCKHPWKDAAMRHHSDGWKKLLGSLAQHCERPVSHGRKSRKLPSKAVVSARRPKRDLTPRKQDSRPRVQRSSAAVSPRKRPVSSARR